MTLSMNVVILLYLVASVFFIQALKGLSHPSTSRQGNAFGMIGMAIAIVTTVALVYKLAPQLATAGMVWVLVGLVVGGAIGTTIAFKVEMTKMPEMVAFMHSMIGLAAVFIAIAAVAEPAAFGIADASGALPGGNRIELALGAFIGAVTFTGSVIAFGKLSGKYKFRLFQGAPVVFPGQHKLNLALGLAAAFFCFGFWHSQSPMDFALIVALGFLLGVLLIIPIGGADMPVVVSMLNSYSGWAAAGIGFSLNNFMLIVAGSLVGSSGAILSYIMCKAMNRSFFNVILGGFGGEVAAADGHGRAAAGALGLAGRRGLPDGKRRDRHHRAGLRPGGRACAAPAEGTRRQADRQGRDGEVRDPPGRGPHAGPHERAAGRGRGALRPGVRDGGRQRRVRRGRCRADPRRQRRRQSGREGPEVGRSPACRSWRPTRPSR